MTDDGLSEALRNYVPADAREAEHRERMLVLAGAERRFDRTRYDPGHFTASAFVLSPGRDSVLLVFHRKLGIWVQPGGHVEPSDTSLGAAAEREAMEEVGFSELVPALPGLPILDVDVHPIPARRDEPAHDHFDVRFLFVAKGSEFSASDEVLAARWVRFDEVFAMASDESVRRAVRKLRPLGRAD